MQTTGNEFKLELDFDVGTDRSPFGTLFIEHANASESPGTWEVVLNDGAPVLFTSAVNPRSIRMKLTPGQLKEYGNLLHFRRISGGAILLDGIGLER